MYVSRRFSIRYFLMSKIIVTQGSYMWTVMIIILRLEVPFEVYENDAVSFIQAANGQDVFLGR